MREKKTLYFDVRKHVTKTENMLVTNHAGHKLLGARVLGHGLGALGDGVLGELTGKEETNGRLDLTGGDGGPLVVVGETTGLRGDALEDVVDERIHDAHGFRADPSVGMNLLQDLVDVDGVGLLPLAVLLPGTILADAGLRTLGGFLLAFSGNVLGWHDDAEDVKLDDFRDEKFRVE